MISKENIDRDLKIKVNNCPHCKETYIIKYGKYKNEQRYLCKMCRKTFSARTNTPWYYSRKDINTWRKYYNLLFNMETLRNTALKVKISLPTAFYWRHKILFALKNDVDVSVLGDTVQIIKRIRKENRKGVKNVAQIPRRDIWVYFLADNSDGIIGCPSCIDNWNKENFMKIIYKKIDSNSYIYSRGDRYTKNIATDHNKNIKGNSDNKNIPNILNIVEGFNKVTCQCRGISSKYIKKYMYLVAAFNKKTIFSINSIIENMSGGKNYIKSSIIKDNPILDFKN